MKKLKMITNFIQSPWFKILYKKVQIRNQLKIKIFGLNWIMLV